VTVLCANELVDGAATALAGAELDTIRFFDHVLGWYSVRGVS